LASCWGKHGSKFQKRIKKKYDTLAAQEKLRFQRDVAKYKEEHPESSEEEKEKVKKPVKKKRKKKDPNAPKKNVSAFFHFSNRIRPKIKAENPKATFGEIGKLVGAAWGKLEPSDKKEYDALAVDDKARYEKEFSAYKVKSKKEESDTSSSDSNSSDSSDSDSSSSSDSETD